MTDAIMKNLKSLERKLGYLESNDDIRIAYDYAVKVKNGLLALHQERHFGRPSHRVAPMLTGCHGYVHDGMAVLTIAEALPHKKELTGPVVSHWQGCIHGAIHVLAQKHPLPRFEKALVGIHVAMPRGSNNARIWDTSNRAIDLILNNLKGIFFPDDNSEHMAFAVVGSWADAPLTRVVIGDLDKNPSRVLDKITNAFG